MGTMEHVRELTVADLEFIHKESSVGDYFTIDDDGQSVQLHDVVTRQPLTPYAIPQGVLQNSELAAGIDWFRESPAAGRLTVQMVLGMHGSADDFRKIVQENGTQLSGSWMALEMSWRSQHMRDMQPDRVTKELAEHKYAGRREFQTEQLLWAYDNKKDIIPCELPVDSDSVLAEELKHLWYDIYEPIREATDITPAVRDAASHISERAYQATRQWAIVAQLGNWMMRLDEAGRLPDHQWNLPLVIGRWHERSAERFDLLGVATEVYQTSDQLYDTPEKLRYGQVVMEAMITGRADMDLLQIPLAN